jgi:hypothetical protein
MMRSAIATESTRLDPLKRFAGLLDELRQRSVYRSLRATAGVDFTSNDYLALADSSRMRQALIDALERGVPSGSGGSRLCGAAIPNMSGSRRKQRVSSGRTGRFCSDQAMQPMRPCRNAATWWLTTSTFMRARTTE